jgi:dihydroflavonol-4-reductase
MRPRGVLPLSSWAEHGLAYAGELRAAFTGRPPIATVQTAHLHSLNWYVSSAKARADLGYAPRPLSHTLRDTHRWYRAQEGMRLNGVTRWWMRAAG